MFNAFRMLFAALSLLIMPAMAVEPTVTGNFENGECVACHQESEPALIAEWHSGPHGQSEIPVDCVACHGKNHEQSAIKARQDSACNHCHGGKEGGVSHSYSTSKHGIIARLEAAEYDWSKPLTVENYRAPGCAFCHFSQGHNVSKFIGKGKAVADAQEANQQRRWLCQQCHSPRYISELDNNGSKMLALGEMKLREAAAVVALAQKEFSTDQLSKIEALYHSMESETLTALRVGIAHQSPDYQWWHGHPALDGKLLRIKGELNRLRRERWMEQQGQEGLERIPTRG